ncbi:MAG: ABC transporter ATP-binding protein [Acidimicrobiales bacterium]
MSTLTLSHVGKVYDDGTRAVKDLNIDIGDGELVVFVGPSGCGKTTALRMVAGLESITEGEIRIGDRVVNNVPPRDRDIAMVFQSYALYPHLSVRDNIGFGLALRKVPKGEMKKQVEEAARVLGLSEYLDRKPRNLSGGQRQRVAMGRAIVRHPQAFLMDEPLSNLDAKLRVQTRAEIARIQRDLSVTTIYVTHDQVEAMTLGHRVAVMKKGVLQQIAPPQVLYDWPDNLFVAGFIGSPAMNFLPSSLEKDGDGAFSVTVGAETLAVPAEVVASHPLLGKYVGQNLIIGFRPEDMQDASLVNGSGQGSGQGSGGGPGQGSGGGPGPGPSPGQDSGSQAPGPGPGPSPSQAPGSQRNGSQGSGGRTLSAFAELVEPLGSDLMVHMTVDIPPVQGNEDVVELAKESGDTMFAREGKAALVARFNPRSPVKEQERVVVAIDTSRLHFFDPHTGVAIRDEKTRKQQEEKKQ